MTSAGKGPSLPMSDFADTIPGGERRMQGPSTTPSRPVVQPQAARTSPISFGSMIRDAIAKSGRYA